MNAAIAPSPAKNRLSPPTPPAPKAGGDDPHNRLNQSIITAWPLLKLHNWTYADLWAVLRDCGIPTSPCDNHRQLAHYFTHYTKLQPLLRHMLASSDDEAKRTAARQICMAAFAHPEAEHDLAAVLGGDKTCRQAAGQIYGQNHIHPPVRSLCEKHLLPLLNDADSEVRGSADYWITHLKEVIANGDWNFFRQYLETTSFAEEPGMALHQLREISSIPQDVVLRIATRAVELSRADTSAPPVKAFRLPSTHQRWLYVCTIKHMMTP